jgi:hypothetical protein
MTEILLPPRLSRDDDRPKVRRWLVFRLILFLRLLEWRAAPFVTFLNLHCLRFQTCSKNPIPFC